MNESTLDPERHWKPDTDERVESPRAASERAPSKTAGQPRSLDVATCSLPMSIVDDAAFHLSYAARMANELRRPDMADKLIAIARDLIFRADAARATERQPEENKQI